MVRRNFSKNADGEARTRKRLTVYDFLRQTELQSCLAHFVLEQLAHRLDEFEMHFLGQSSDVMMAFDHLRGIALDRHALNHIRIKRALRQKFVAAPPACRRAGRTRRGEFAVTVHLIFLEEFLGGMLKYFDEFIADQLSLRFGVGHSLEQFEKTITGVHIFQTHVKILAENALDDFFFSRAEQTVVYKNAGELVTDCPVQKRSGH